MLNSIIYTKITSFPLITPRVAGFQLQIKRGSQDGFPFVTGQARETLSEYVGVEEIHHFPNRILPLPCQVVLEAANHTDIVLACPSDKHELPGMGNTKLRENE